ncbi:MAG: biopolymer transporter ExbD [Anaerohalosphaeraceae bacterium]|nr:biopolymer transporter ExbD [Anaerohalosphaeraceae bacterium]
MKVNLTPVIDIVFLLIIFLIVVYQGSNDERIELLLPTNCNFANTKSENAPALAISIFKDEKDDAVIFAAGTEKFKKTSGDSRNVSNWLTKMINASLPKNTSDSTSKSILLRIDKDITYRNAQLVLSAISKSRASELEIATVKSSFEF